MPKDASNNQFLPEDYLERKRERRTNLICVSLFLVVLVGVIAAFYVTDQQRHEVRSQLSLVNAEFETRALQIKQIEKLQDQKRNMMNKARITAQLVEVPPRPLLLSELINQMPTSLRLIDIELETKVTRAPSRTALQKAKKDRKEKKQVEELTVPDRDVTLTLEGVAPNHQDIAIYQERLTANNLFVGVNLGGIEKTDIDGREMLRFKIEAKLNQDIDLSGLEPTRVARSPERDPMADELGVTPDGEFLANPRPEGPISQAPAP